jgi:diguanylate cyclase (GGDEF)-like protein
MNPGTGPAIAACVLEAVNLGTVLLDAECRIVLWNSWMARHTGFTPDSVLGQDFFAIFPELVGKRLDSAVRQALRDHFPSVLSQTLHKSPLPLFANSAAQIHGVRIAQAVAVTPLDVPGKASHCLIQVSDVSVAVHREKLLRDQTLELRSQTFSDGLTGIANRRHFDVAMENEVRRAKRAGLPLSLLMIDIDCFKAYNDFYGHQQGDQCLIRVAASLSAMLHRPTDMIARYGGEEFAVILPEVDAEHALLMADAMRETIARLDIPHEKSEAKPHVTVSIGVATQPIGNPSEVPALIGAADRALYAAKRGGRDRAEAQPAS